MVLLIFVSISFKCYAIWELYIILTNEKLRQVPQSWEEKQNSVGWDDLPDQKAWRRQRSPENNSAPFPSKGGAKAHW